MTTALARRAQKLTSILDVAKALTAERDLDKLLPLILQEAAKLGVKPGIGVRLRLSTLGAGKWQNSGGDKAKFGLSPRQVLDLVARLRAAGISAQVIGKPNDQDAIRLIRNARAVFEQARWSLQRRWSELSYRMQAMRDAASAENLKLRVEDVKATLDGLRSLNQMVEGTNLPRLNMEAIERMIHRDSLALLGIRKS